MPSIKASSLVDRSRLGDPLPLQAEAAPGVPPPPAVYAPSAFLICSVPQGAASYDLFLRQFYSQAGMPQQRIAPKGQ